MMYDRIMILLFDNSENLYGRLIKFDWNNYDFRFMQFNIMTSISTIVVHVTAITPWGI